MTPRPVRWNCPAGNEIDHVRVLLLDRIEAALRAEAERSHLAGLEFAWHEDPTLNAAVQRAGAGPTLEIHTGTVARIVPLFCALLTDPEFLPHVGDAAAHPEIVPVARGILRGLLARQDDPVYVVESPDMIEFRVVSPADPERARVAMAMVTIALDFVVWHELAHLARGHLELLPDEGRRLCAVWPGRPPHAGDALVRALEHDADTCAALASAAALVGGESLLSCSEAAPAGHPEAAMLHYALAMMLFFHFFESRVLDLEQHRLSMHPHPELRFWNVYKSAGTVFARAWGDVGRRQWPAACEQAAALLRPIQGHVGLELLEVSRRSWRRAWTDLERLDRAAARVAPRLQPLRVIERVNTGW